MSLDVEGPDGADTVPSPTFGSTVATRLSREDADSVAAAIEDSYAANTRRAYASSIRRYRSWLAVQGYASDWDPLIVAAYLASMAADAPSSVEVARAAILHAAGRDGGADAASLLRDHPGVRATVRGVRRQQRGYTPTKARALSRPEIGAMVETCPETPQGQRDRAVLLLGVSLGLRASDLVAIRVAGVTGVDGGLEVVVPYSKTAGQAITLALPTIGGGTLDATEALTSWLRIVERVDGEEGRGSLVRAIRRGGWSVGAESCGTEVVATIVHRLAEAAGIDTDHGRVSSHTLRATFATRSLELGYSEAAVAATGRWASVTVLRGYDRATRWQPERAVGGWLGR